MFIAVLNQLKDVSSLISPNIVKKIDNSYEMDHDHVFERGTVTAMVILDTYVSFSEIPLAWISF